MDISLTFINNSNATSSDIVIFQKNEASRAGQFAVAWQVFKNSVPGSRYPFTYTEDTAIGLVSDDVDLSYTSGFMLAAENGRLYSVYKNAAGYTISGSQPTVNRENIQVQSHIQMEIINVGMYRDGRLLAIRSGIAPQQKAVFEFKPVIWIGAVSRIEEGDLMNSAILSQINTQISLTGIAKADIVMTGGGVGSDLLPFVFTLENVVAAPDA